MTKDELLPLSPSTPTDEELILLLELMQSKAEFCLSKSFRQVNLRFILPFSPLSFEAGTYTPLTEEPSLELLPANPLLRYG